MHFWAFPTMLAMQKTLWNRAENALLGIPDHVGNAKNAMEPRWKCIFGHCRPCWQCKKRYGTALKMHVWAFPTMLTMQKTLCNRAENAFLGIPDHVGNAKNGMEPR